MDFALTVAETVMTAAATAATVGFMGAFIFAWIRERSGRC